MIGTPLVLSSVSRAVIGENERALRKGDQRARCSAVSGLRSMETNQVSGGRSIVHAAGEAATLAVFGFAGA